MRVVEPEDSVVFYPILSSICRKTPCSCDLDLDFDLDVDLVLDLDLKIPSEMSFCNFEI